MKKLVFSTLLTLQALAAFAQGATGIMGKVVDSKTLKPMADVTVSVQNTAFTQITDATGSFAFDHLDAGKAIVEVKSAGYQDQHFPVDVAQGKILDMGTLSLDVDVTDEQQQSLVAITDNDLDDDNSGSETTSGLLQASRDAFSQAAAFNWGQARFRIRGLDNEFGTTMINGVVMNKVYDGRPQWGNWGGLNDATRNQEFTLGSGPSDYTFGGILGTQEINTRASIYRRGTRISAAGTNTNYDGRLMGTTASGMRNDGWAYVISASRRFAQEGYFEGTTYDANSFFASVEKKLSDNNSLDFTSIYARNERGKNSPNTQEVTDLAGIKYNSYWGYQNGDKRNSRNKIVEEPIFMLTDYWKVNPKTNVTLNFAYQFGKVGNSRLDYQGVNNPDPTYYRNLPSYFTSLYNTDPATVQLTDPSQLLPGGLGGIPTPDQDGADAAQFYSQKQIDWANLYHVNQLNGVSRYVLYEDRTDDRQWTANATMSSQIADNIVMNAGGSFLKLKSHNFANLLDLLGGQYYEDISLFGVGQQQQSDLDHPFRQVGEGDTFKYNYNLFATRYNGFTQFKFTYKKIDFYLAQEFSHSEYQREGLYHNGYYPTNSFGFSKKQFYDNFGFKGGATYKLSGRHFITVNGAYMTDAPTLRNAFNNGRVNNNATQGVRSSLIYSADASYIINAPRFKSRLTAFYSKVDHATQTAFFFAEGVSGDITGEGDANEFVAETLTNLDTRNMGVELGMEWQITSTLKATASGNYGEYIYANNPQVTIAADSQAAEDNLDPTRNYGAAHMKNYKMAGTPQTAASIGLEYRDPHYWWIGVNENFIGNNYIDVAPILRTDYFYVDQTSINGNAFPEATADRGRQLLKQEKFDDFYLLNLSGGKSWKVRKYMFGFFASISNVLDETYKTGGFEQARNANYRQLNQDVSSGTPAFGPKYFYGYGRTYFVNIYLNF
jgi:hypothetical protein